MQKQHKHENQTLPSFKRVESPVKIGVILPPVSKVKVNTEEEILHKQIQTCKDSKNDELMNTMVCPECGRSDCMVSSERVPLRDYLSNMNKMNFDTSLFVAEEQGLIECGYCGTFKKNPCMPVMKKKA